MCRPLCAQDFQFFNVPRLTEIFDKENAYELFKHSQAQKEAAARQQVREALSSLTCVPSRPHAAPHQINFALLVCLPGPV